MAHAGSQTSKPEGIMFYDLNVPIPNLKNGANTSKKGKAANQDTDILYSPSALASIEGRIDLLVHCKRWSTSIPEFG